MVSPPRPLPHSITVALFVVVAGCASAPVSTQEPARVSAESSGRATADAAASAARDARPDNEAEDNKTRWIYASNMNPPGASDETDEPTEPSPESKRDAASKSDSASDPSSDPAPRAAETNQKTTPDSASAPIVKLIVEADGTYRSADQSFDTAKDAAAWASSALQASNTNAVELYVASDVDFQTLQGILDALRSDGVSKFSIAFSPSTDDDKK